MRRSAWIGQFAAALWAAILLLVAACSEEPEREEAVPPPAPETGTAEETADAVLSDTQWHLVEIREAGGGSVVPENPESYEFRFRADGTLAMRLNCNRASAAWSAEEIREGRGALIVGPPVMTRAHCLPPSIDERVAGDVESMSAYALDGDRLHLALRAGGTYVLRPVQAPD